MKKEKTYYRTKLIGKETYGTVYRAKDEEIYALKIIKLQGDDEGIPSTAIREIWEKLKDVIHVSKKITLVFEYIERDLKKIINATMGEGLELKLIKSYLYQLLKGMTYIYIYKYKILHRDLKPQNLLISQDDILKIADFGLARGYELPVKKLHTWSSNIMV